MIRFALVLRHINYCTLFTVKSSLYIFICKHILLITFLNEHSIKWFQVLQCITNNSIKHQSFIYTLLNDLIVLFQAIQFSKSHLFLLSLNFKQFYWAQRYDLIRCYHPGPDRSRKRWQWRGNPHYPKLQHYWSLTIKLFSIISRTLVGDLTPLKSCIRCTLHSPANWAS